MDEYASSKIVIFISMISLFIIHLGCESKHVPVTNNNHDNVNHKSDENLVVNTEYGQVRGFYQNYTRAFYGIPYALPPIGKRRWMRPSEPKSWTPRVLDATKEPPSCLQNEETQKHTVEGSEDCLYINVYTPVDTTSTSNLPVIVIIHGGIFIIHSGLTPKSDGRFLAAKGSVVVSFNYRLGALGFLATNSPDITGNYGIMDQRLALKFVRENIQSFGGNPDKVTIMGPSAGSQSIALHLTSDASDQFFSQAILSGNPFTKPYRTKSEMASDTGTLFAEYLNCSNIDTTCLKSRSARDIIDVQIRVEKEMIEILIKNFTTGLLTILKTSEIWSPVIDGLEVTADPLVAWRAGQYQKKPLILGSNRDEYRTAAGSNISMALYLTSLLLAFEWDSVVLATKYPPLPFGDSGDQLTAVLTDYIAGCSNRLVGRLAANDDIPIFHYLYSFASPPLPDVTESCIGYSCHASEVIPEFGTFKLVDFTPTPDFKLCSDSMLYSWSNFAHTGNPADHTWAKTKESHPYWPKYESGTGWQSYEFTNSDNKILYDYRNGYCDLWDSLGYIEDGIKDFNKC